MTIRKLKTGDEAALETFLSGHAETSMFLRSNLRTAGFEYDGMDFQGEYFGAFTDRNEQTICGVMALYWNGNLMVQAPCPETLDALISYFAARITRPVAGFIGADSQIMTIINRLGLDTQSFALNSNEGLYTLDLDKLVMPESYDHNRYALMPARDMDKELLREWLGAYNIEALGAAENQKHDSQTESDVARTLSGHSRWGLLVDDRPVALSGFNAELPDIVQIGPVWTPPAHRGKGHARVIVALSLQKAREKGVKRAILFTDNPAAAKAYKAVGFVKGGAYRLALLKDSVTLQDKIAV